MNLNFKKEIDKAYAKIGMIPINGQEYSIDRVLTAFLINRKRNVILMADTGTGKSIIATIVSLVIKEYFNDEFDDELLPSTIAVHSNSLVKQYKDTFKDYPRKEVLHAMGASNYPCDAGIEINDDVLMHNAENCFRSTASPHIQRTYCDNCLYQIDRTYLNRTDMLITNYSYQIVSSLWSKHLSERKLTVFDEAHTLNDVFCNSVSIQITVDELTKHIDICGEYPSKNREHAKLFASLKSDLINHRINESNYVSKIKELQSAYIGMFNSFNSLVKDYSDNGELDGEQNKELTKLKKLESRYKSAMNKIDDLFEYKYEHIFDDSEDNKIKVTPIFMKDFSHLILSDLNLFMSATISDEYMYQTMGLDRDKTEFIQLDTVYEPEQKQVLFIGNHYLTYNTMKDRSVINELKETINAIVESGSADGQKGIILTSSFAMGDMVESCIPKNVRIFNHERGKKVDVIINQFKRYKGVAVLISPSIYEGVDFSDDYSRYQIIVKAPFQSLSDKRVAYIAKKYPDIYKIMTLKKIVQGLGRSIRNKDDYAVSFILDKNINRLFDSNLNVWKKQFFIQ